MSELVPSTYTAVPTVTIAPSTPAQLLRLQSNIDFATPYLVNRNPAIAPPYIPGRTLPYTPSGAETNPFVTPSGGFRPPSQPVNASAPVNIATGAAVSRIAGGLALLPTLGTAIGNVATGAGNIGSILSGNEEDVQPLQPYSSEDPLADFNRRMDESGENLREIERRWNEYYPTPEDATFPDRAINGLGRLACSIFGLGCPETTPEGIPTNGSPGQLPPFRGGQSAGVMYRVTVTRRVPGMADNTHYRDVWGKVYSLGVDTRMEGNVSVGTIYVYAAASSSNQTPTYYPIVGGSGGTQFLQTQIVSSNIARVDGQPDTGGNPAPLPNAAYQPATSPALHGVHQPNTSPSNFSPGNLAPGNPPNPATQPIDTPAINPLTPGNPPAIQPADSDEDSPLNPLNPLLPLLGLGLGAALLPGLINRLRNAFNTGSSGTSGSSENDPNLNCRFREDTVSHNKLDLQYAFLQAMEANQTRILNRIDNKLGVELPGGGISSFLKKFFNMFNLDRILNILTFVTVIHNAFMLSNAIGQTLFSAFDSALQIFGGELKDAEDNQISTGEFIGEAIENFFKSIFGDQTVESVQVFWRNANRIYQAAMNIVYSLQSVMDSLTSSLELIGNYVAKIGNAMKKFGVVAEKAYGWMNPNHNFHQGRFWNFLNRTQDAAEVAESITSNALNITEEVSNIREQQTEFKDSVDTIEAQLNTTESANKTDSQSPSYSDSDLIKPEE